VDAVFNVQRVSLLLGALCGGRLDLIGTAMDDRLHQPYRRRLFPWMDTVASAARAAGALGCALSGAGPSMLAAVGRAPEAVARAMEEALRASGGRGRALTLAVDHSGVTCTRTEGAANP
jgi:homoserine kinase